MKRKYIIPELNIVKLQTKAMMQSNSIYKPGEGSGIDDNTGATKDEDDNIGNNPYGF